MSLKGRLDRLIKSSKKEGVCAGCGGLGAVRAIVIVDPVRGEPPQGPEDLCSICGSIRGPQVRVIEWPESPNGNED